MSQKIVLVLAGNMQQYRDWVRAHPGVRSQCVMREHDCCGYDPKTSILTVTGTWYKHQRSFLQFVSHRFGDSERFVYPMHPRQHGSSTRNRPMFLLKNDSEAITWDWRGMAAAGENVK